MTAAPMFPVTEAQLSAAVIELASRLGWRVMGVRTSQTAARFSTAWLADGKGWPDLFLVRGEWALAVELKVGSNRPTVEQQAWAQALEQVPGILTYTWWQRDWRDGTVEAVLRDPVAAGEAA